MRMTETETQLWQTAYHEAGHAVVARKHGFMVDGISILRGQCIIRKPISMTREQAYDYCMILSAGYIAVKLHVGRSMNYGTAAFYCGGKDLARINALVKEHGLTWTEKDDKKAIKIVKQAWSEIETLAKTLVTDHLRGV